MKKTLIMLPTYNEEKNIEVTLKLIFEKVFLNTEITVVVIDSASTDDTVKKVEQLQNKYKNLFLLRQDSKKGLASAYIEGLTWGMNRDESFDVFVQMDADLQHPVDVLPEMITAADNYDLVIGSRYVRGGGWDKKGNHPLKSFISSCGSFFFTQEPC